MGNIIKSEKIYIATCILDSDTGYNFIIQRQLNQYLFIKQSRYNH